MAIDPHYIPAFSIEEVILDKDTGAPLSGGIVTFEQDNNRGILKPVYQITGTSPNYTYIQLPNPMTLSAIGTFEDSLGNPVVPYFFPFDGALQPEYYFVRVQSSGLVSQFNREAVPYIPEELNPSENTVSFSNELSNPQFAEVLFDTVSASYVYNFAGATLQAIEIAPGWELVVTGTGTVTVSQTRPAGTLNRPTNPGTLLNINSSGITLLQLRQRLYGSPNLFGSGYLSGFFVAKTFSASSSVINMTYSQSNGLLTTPVTVIAATVPATGAYTTFASNVLIPASTSVDTFPDAYVDITLELPIGINFELTSIQAVATGAQSVVVPYDEDTNNRQIDHLFHYYQTPIDFKPVPSLLCGWDFPLNPAQILGPTVTMNTTNKYIWDQTIGASVVGNVAIVRNAVTGGFQATTANNDEAFYVMQYLSGAQARKMLGTTLSVNINGFRTQAGGIVTARVYLYRGNAAAVFPVLPLTVGGATPLNAAGIFTLNTSAGEGLNWTLIPRSNFGQGQGTLSTVNTADYSTLNDVIDLQFSGWEIVDTAQIADTDKFAIVVTLQCPTTGSVVVMDSISLVPGDIPTRPAPQSADEVVRECYFYYESSKAIGVPLSTSGADNTVVMQQFMSDAGAGNVALNTRSFGLQYKSNKVKVPTTTLYAENGTSNNVSAYIYQGASGQIGAVANLSAAVWTQQDGGTKGISFVANTSAPYMTRAATFNQYLEGFLSFHYAADARLGI